MNTPYYTVVVANLSRGWSFEATHGEEADPDADAMLVDPLTYAWAFAGDVMPSHMEPSTATVNLAARSATLVPEVQVGDLITIDVRVGTTGDRIIAPPPMRAAEPVVTLITHKYPARLSIPLSDLSIDWRGRPLIGQAPPPVGEDWSATMRRAWRERLAEYGYLLGLSVGAPTTWGGTTRPTHPFDSSIDALVLTDYPGGGSAGYPGNAVEAFARTLNSHHPSGHVHVPVPYYGASHPSGYGYVGPSSWSTATGNGPITEPASTARIELVPVSRSIPTSAGLPLKPEVSGGLLRLAPTAPASGNVLAQIGLHAGWCVLPATARRSREAAINAVSVEGQVGIDTAPGDFDSETGSYELVDTADAATRGISQRSVPMDLYLGNRYVFNTNTYPVPWPAVGPAMAPFFSDPSARSASWSYDAFEVRSSKIPQDVADWLLPLLAPRLPGETDGDGRLVRHITIFDIETEKRFNGQPVTGFVVAGAMTIADGEIVWNLTTAPGEPIWTGGSTPAITVGQIDAASYQAQPIGSIDPAITLADLAHVAA